MISLQMVHSMRHRLNLSSGSSTVSSFPASPQAKHTAVWGSTGYRHHPRNAKNQEDIHRRKNQETKQKEKRNKELETVHCVTLKSCSVLSEARSESLVQRSAPFVRFRPYQSQWSAATSPAEEYSNVVFSLRICPSFCSMQTANSQTQSLDKDTKKSFLIKLI